MARLINIIRQQDSTVSSYKYWLAIFFIGSLWFKYVSNIHIKLKHIYLFLILIKKIKQFNITFNLKKYFLMFNVKVCGEQEFRF